jgi:hypothetical protein
MIADDLRVSEAALYSSWPVAIPTAPLDVPSNRRLSIQYPTVRATVNDVASNTIQVDNVTVRPAVTPLPAGTVVGLWHFDDNITGAIGPDFNIQTVQNTHYYEGRFDKGIDMDTWGYANLPASIDPEVTPVTIEYWVKPNIIYRSLMNLRTGDDHSGDYTMTFNQASDKVWNITWRTTANTTAFNHVLDPAPALDVWTHMAMVIGREEVSWYVDGIRRKVLTRAAIAAIGTMRPFKCVSTDSIEGPYWDELRVSTVEQYTGDSFTVPTTPFEPALDTLGANGVTVKPVATSAAVFNSTLSLHHFDGSTASALGSSNDFIFGGTDTSIYSTPLAKFGQTGKAQGSVQPYANLTSSVNLSTDSVTFESWLSADGSTIGASGNWINHTFNNGTGAGDAKVWVAVSKAGGTDWQLRFYYVGSSTFANQVFTLTGKAITADLGPIHVATVYDGGNIEFFADGARLGTYTGTVISDTVTMVRSDAVRTETVYADEIRVTKTALYSGTTYTVPTAPFT